MTLTIDQHARPVIFGECLFDHYPDGNKVLAGAPLAVAWHLQGFGLRPLLITRIGQDIEGEIALTLMHQWGLDTCAVQIDTEHATGSVTITSENNENKFEIKSNQAWDHISSHLSLEWVRTLPCSLLYAGTLAQRSPISHKTLQRLILETNLPVFIDLNLRKPWTKQTIIEQSLDEAHWVKLNNEELKEIANSEKELKKQHDIETIYNTRGKKGAVVINEKEHLEIPAEKITNLKDTVGAGDAFSAVCILGLHKSWTLRQTTARANEFAAKICQYQGATALSKHDYKDFLTKWNSMT